MPGKNVIKGNQLIRLFSLDLELEKGVWKKE